MHVFVSPEADTLSVHCCLIYNNITIVTLLRQRLTTVGARRCLSAHGREYAMRCVQARFSGQDVSHYIIIFVSLDGRLRCTLSNRYPTTIHIILLLAMYYYYYYDYRTEATLIHYWWTTPCDATRAEHLGAAAGHKSGSEQDLVCTRQRRQVGYLGATDTHPHTHTQAHSTRLTVGTRVYVRLPIRFFFPSSRSFFALYSHRSSVDGFHGTHTRSRARPRVTVRQ